jgi:hypothetical protein
MTPRVAALFVISLSIACAGTHVSFVGGVEADRSSYGPRSRLLTELEGTLSVGRVLNEAKVEIDPEFDTQGFARVAHPLIVTKGEDVVLVLEDDASAPSASLYLQIAPDVVASHRVIADGEFIPYLDLHIGLRSADEERHVFGAVCKGGRGRLTIAEYSSEKVDGDVALRVTCRTYIDGYEREESDLRLAGPFSLKL